MSSRPNPIRRLYDWTLKWAETRYALPALVALAFAESSVFPIPPDVLLIAMALAVPARAFTYAAWCTVGSVFGALLGYYIGFGLWQFAEPHVVGVVISQANFDLAQSKFHEYGAAVMFTAAFTPVPFKVFTVTAGVTKLPLLSFLGASLVGRAARFMLVALVIRMLGDRARQFIDRYFNVLTIAGTLLLVGGFAALKLMHR